MDGLDQTELGKVSIQMIFTDADRLPVPNSYPKTLDSVYATVELKSLTSFPATVTITPDDIIEAIPDFMTIADFGLGDNINLVFSITTTDGIVLTTALNSDLCLQPAQPSFGGCNMSIDLICPFVEADILGTYLLVEDGFPASLDPSVPIHLVAGNAPNTYIFLNMFQHPEMYDLTITVDPETSIVTMKQQDAFNTANLIGTVVNSDFGVATLYGSGVFLSCLGKVSMDLRMIVGGGSSFGPETYTLQKQ